MGDWREFELDEAGERRSWTRQGDISRYVEGACAKVIWVGHPWKPSVAQRWRCCAR
jgi:hypothetical protein